MITESQVRKLRFGDIVHAGECILNGKVRRIERWRVNGAFHNFSRKGTWRIPLKHGLRYYSEINPQNAYFFHLEAECPLTIKKETTI
jgi:hypothetical protein